jgi:hypothetical protein
MKARAEINEIKTKKSIQRINEIKIWSFEKTDKIDKPLVSMTKKEKVKKPN